MTPPVVTAREAFELTGLFGVLRGRRLLNGVQPSEFLDLLDAQIRVMSGHEVVISGCASDGVPVDVHPLGMPLALTVDEAARQLMVSATLVKRLIKKGELRAVHVSDGATRILADDLRAFLDDLDVTAPGTNRALRRPGELETR